MFTKPFRIKTQTAIRGSDRKKIRADIGKAYPSLSDDALNSLFPSKEEMSSMKIYSHSGENLTVYCLKKNPIFFELEKRIYPTVYTMWQHPDLLPAFTTYTPVLTKLSGGADLMLPGVVTGGDVTPRTFRHVQKGDMCLINTTDNSAGMAVGLVAMSGEDMYMSGMRGKGVQIIHVYKDQLWAHGDQSEPPQFPPPVVLDTTSPSNDDVTSPDTALTSQRDDVTSPECPDVEGGATGEAEDVAGAMGNLDLNEDDGDTENLGDGDGENEAIDTDEPVVEMFEETHETMDALLKHCLLCALKADVKDDELPVLTSKLLRTYMVPWCPSGRSLDVKKSSYKKLTKFLHCISDDKLLVVKELSKGVDSVTEVNRAHPDYKDHVVPDRPVHFTDTDDADKPYQPPRLDELFAVSGNTVNIFKHAQIPKGAALEPGEVRKYVKEYVKAKDLIVPNDPRTVALDDVLSEALLNKGERDVTHLAWDQLFARTMSKMSSVMRITYPGQEPRIVKGKLQPINLSTATRSGNKKVTLIDNLEQFGIDPARFAHELQIGVAGSTAVNPLPGKKQGVQVLVQGNQINYVAELLMGKYNINKKYLTGLDKAPKPSKKKR